MLCLNKEVVDVGSNGRSLDLISSVMSSSPLAPLGLPLEVEISLMTF
jgi:hypothetical protein